MTTRASTVKGVPQSDIPAAMPHIRPFLENFAKRDLDGATAEDYEAEVLRGAYQVWNINDWQACALTRLTTEAVRITHCAGVDRRAWQESLEDTVKEWGRALGRKRVIGTVRPGWAKFAKKRGYREAHREMVCEI
jgi:hypothetical protein